MNDAANDEAELLQLNWDLQVATWKADAGWMRKHLSPDFILINTRGIIVNFDDWLKDIATPGLPFEPTEVEVRLFDKSAIVTARLQIPNVSDGERVTVDLRYTDVWIKGDDGWKYVAAHASPIAVKREPA